MGKVEVYEFVVGVYEGGINVEVGGGIGESCIVGIRIRFLGKK